MLQIQDTIFTFIQIITKYFQSHPQNQTQIQQYHQMQKLFFQILESNKQSMQIESSILKNPSKMSQEQFINMIRNYRNIHQPFLKEEIKKSIQEFKRLKIQAKNGNQEQIIFHEENEQSQNHSKHSDMIQQKYNIKQTESINRKGRKILIQLEQYLRIYIEEEIQKGNIDKMYKLPSNNDLGRKAVEIYNVMYKQNIKYNFKGSAQWINDFFIRQHDIKKALDEARNKRRLTKLK